MRNASSVTSRESDVRGCGVSADGDAGLRALIDGAERSPAAMMRAVSLLPLLPVDALIESHLRGREPARWLWDLAAVYPRRGGKGIRSGLCRRV